MAKKAQQEVQREEDTRKIHLRQFVWKHTKGEEVIMAVNTAEARQQRQDIAIQKGLHWKRDSIEFYEVKS